VVGDYAEGDSVFEEGFVGIGSVGVDVVVSFSRELFQFTEVRGEGIGVVVGRLLGKVFEAIRVLHDGDHALEAHASIDMLGGEVTEGAVGFGIVLDEDEVPDLDAEVAVGIDELALSIAVRSHVDVELGAGSARSGVAHHPEVVFDVAVDDVNCRVEALGFELRLPKVVGFLVEVGGVTLARRINGGVKALGGKSPTLDEELPSPVDGLGLEVITEGPVPQHLEEGMMIGVVADILEVVVLSSGADAFLGVGGAGGIVGGFFGS